MAVEGKKAQKVKKPSPKLMKPTEEEEDEVEDEEEVDDEELEDDSDAEVDNESGGDEKEATKKEEQTNVDEDDDMQTTIFVGHINFNLNKKKLDDFFSKAGEIKSSRIIPKRGYAFVTFNDAASVDEALKLDKEMLAGKAVHIERVKTKKSDNTERKQQKRKLNKEENEKNAKKAKLGDKTVQLKQGFNKPGKGKPKTPQHTNPNKKKNKSKPGQFVKAVQD